MNSSLSRLQPAHVVLVAVAVTIGFLMLLALFFLTGSAGEEQSAQIAVTPTKAQVAALPLTSPTSVPPATALATIEPVLPSATPTIRPTPTAKPGLVVVDEATVEALLAQLTLEQKLGQMQMVGLPGPVVDARTRERVVRMGVGGVILLERNTTGSQQVHDLAQALQHLALGEGPGLPLFVGWNHEGGPVVRRHSGLTLFPSAMAVGTLDQPETAFAIGEAVAAEMRSVGVNMNFAPVLDVNNEPANPVIGLRAYGDEPERVARQGEATIRGQHQGGVIGVAKHFPGHGNVTVDSHFALPVLTSTLPSLWQTELLPFQIAVAAGVPAMMTAHIRLPNVDPAGWPASLSPTIVTTLLRQQLGYDGVIMTDELGMDAIENNYSLDQAAVQAVLAGNDLLLTVDTENSPEVVHNALLQAVANGQLSEGRIDASVRRLIRLKLAFDLWATPPEPLLPQQAAHQELAQAAGRAAVQVLQDREGLLPLNLPASLVLISPAELNPGSVVGDGQSALGEQLTAAGASVTEMFYQHEVSSDIAMAQSWASALADTTTAYVVVTWDASLRHAQYGEVAQETLVNALLATGKPVVVIFGQLPYDRERLPEAPVQIASYGDGEGQIAGMVERLLVDSGP